ncbi:thiolase C-terminal domain-containing protein [Frankia gtarii]|uniref:thiolase C-terminal domain-containing protein n=1 Tax=Frankia gtarii TaxID=2950102 RepID=UPI003F688979
MTADAADLTAVAGFDRPLPVVNEENAHFWRGGADGVLRFARCNACGALLHPAPVACRYCRSADLGVADVSGRGVVVGATVNHQQWDARFPTPFVIATVAIEEDPRVRVITNLIGVDVDDAHVGMRVRVRFQPVEDVWFPLFEPDGGDVDELPSDETPPDGHHRWVRPMLRTDKFEDRVAITGIGMSQIGRRLMVAPLALTVAAVKDAVADAGLTLDDIDGLSTYPGSGGEGGFGEGGVSALAETLGLRPTWYNGGSETFGPAGSVIAAMLAVSAGLARHVVCFRTVWQATFAAQQRARDPRGANPNSMMAGLGGAGRRVLGYTAPYGVGSAANHLAMCASHHFRRYGTTRETLGWVALNQRANAAVNPRAIYRDPLTMDDYLSARLVSTPFGLYDCDVPADASVAVIVSAVEAAHDLAKPPVLVEAVGTQLTERITWEQSTMTHEPHVFGPAAHLWSRTSLRPSDVQVAELYDGFTFNCVSWLEALGFCGIGEAKDFLDGGRAIARDGGVVALNTHGGQLSAGRTHGMGLMHEAVVQLRGEGGARQVTNAQVAVVSSGGLTPAGVILLRRGR